jgi:hypothetical protein
VVRGIIVRGVRHSRQREIAITITTSGHWLAALARCCRCSLTKSDGLAVTSPVRRVQVRRVVPP